MKTLIVCFYWKKKMYGWKMSRYCVLNVWWIGILFLGSFLKLTHGEIACVILLVTHFFFYLRISKWQSLTNLELNLNNCRLVLFLSHVIVCRAKAKPLLGFSFCDNFPCQSTWGNRSWRLQHTAGQRKKTTCLPWTSSCFSLKLKCLDQIWTQRSLWC